MIKAGNLKDYFLIIVKCLLYFLAAYLCISHLSVPESQLGQRIYSAVITASFFALLAGIVLTSMRCPHRLFHVSLYGVLSALFCIMLTGCFSDAAINNPDTSMVIFISLLFFWLVFRLSTTGNLSTVQLPESSFGTSASLMKMQVRQKRKITEVDRRTIAAHEAGHALLYAALGCLPDDFHIKIKSTEDESNSLGYVSGLRLEHCLNYKTESEWYMLVLLAGKKGERSMGLDESLGASGDMRVWLDLASQYLENQYRGLYYPSPSSDAQIDNNKAELEALKTEQNYLLDSFFAINKIVHNELATELLQQGFMKREQIKTYLDRVEFPASFPQLPHLVRSK